jgi:glycosyltransferase involved in cell wall biosynthesis
LFKDVIENWQPDIIHTLGLEPAGYFYADVHQQYGLENIAKWVAQVRGGPELTLHHLLPECAPDIKRVFDMCDYIIADNDVNYRIISEMGVESHKIPLGRIPGTGGIDIQANDPTNKPSKRQASLIIPKSYEGLQSKVLPVLEALQLAWDYISPCTVHLLAATPETKLRIQTLPEEIRDSCQVYDRIPRSEVLSLIADARVMLAPSLVDGVPNVLYEAMVCGAFPIVSPLETLTPIVKNEENVLFARNLYPNEIADALVRAMNDDDLVDNAAQNNLELVRRIANRSDVRRKAIELYTNIAQDNRKSKDL